MRKSRHLVVVAAVFTTAAATFAAASSEASHESAPSAAVATSAAPGADPHGVVKAGAEVVTAEAALQRLVDGNQHFAAGALTQPHMNQERRCETFAGGQHPIAAVLSCADSRAPVEAVFDQGVGDLFVIRVAGNVAATDEIGTIEYGVDHLGIPLIVVMGHTKCGAVTAVCQGAEAHGSLAGLLGHIAPAVEQTRKSNPGLPSATMVPAAIRANVFNSIHDLLAGSDVIRAAAASGKVKVVGAIYDLHTGEVEWLGTHPQQSELLAMPAAQPGGAAEHDDAKPQARSEQHDAVTSESHEESDKTEHRDGGESGKSEAGAEHAPPTTAPRGPAGASANAPTKKKENFLALAGCLGGSGIATLGILHKFRPASSKAAKTPEPKPAAAAAAAPAAHG